MKLAIPVLQGGIRPADPLVFGFWKVPKNVCADVWYAFEKKICVEIDCLEYHSTLFFVFVFVSYESYNAIANGYRRLDCACDYGNEQEVGQGISRAIQEGLCKREDLFVTSKLWNTYHKPEHVPLAMKKTLADLALSYVDEYLIHFQISMEYGMYLV